MNKSTNKLLFIATLLITAPALAHHPLGGEPMETFFQGFLSGTGHPVLGFDHLFFVAIVGVTAVFAGHRYTAPLAYIAAMLAGCLMMYAGIDLPLKETVIALSVLIMGGIVLSGHGLKVMPAIVIFAGLGLFHGSAFGDSISAQEGGAGTGVLYGYLLGLGITQYFIAVTFGWIVSNLLGAKQATHINARLIGAVFTGAGLLLTMNILEGPVLSFLGLG